MSTGESLFQVKLMKGDKLDDEREVEARDFEHAAEKATEEYDEYDSDYPLAGKGEERTAIVTNIHGKIQKFKMSGYFSANYTAEEIEENEQQSQPG